MSSTLPNALRRVARALARTLPDAASRSLRLGGFLPEPPHLIPDPWGEEDAVFDASFRRISEAVERPTALLRSERA